MVFSDSVFIFIFLPVTLLVYYLAPSAWRNAVLFVSGVVFYAWGEPVYVIVMLISILIDYLGGMSIEHFAGSTVKKKIFLAITIAANISILGVFKYSGFVVETINFLFNTALEVPKLPLPIGISFFTFQAMSYVIDLYRGDVKLQKNFVDFAAYVSMFPQIVAGPIVRYGDVAQQLDDRKLSIAEISDGIEIFIIGLGKKVLIANSTGSLWSSVKDADFASLSAANAWLGIIAFTLQIYYDFSGYSDMAVGLGKMLGFKFPMNFDYPYESKSVSEFWRRWHMTLGGWFKSYVYIPLGGNRKGNGRTILNLFIVWSLTGLWHGASWNFVLWGIYYFILLVGERFVYAGLLKKSPRLLNRLYTLAAVVLGWIMFEISSPTDQLSFIGALFGRGGFAINNLVLHSLHNYLFIILIAAIGCTSLPKRFMAAAKTKWPKFVSVVSIVYEFAVLVLCIANLVDSGYNPFLYFNF